jgi:hypothetical protein
MEASPVIRDYTERSVLFLRLYRPFCYIVKVMAGERNGKPTPPSAQPANPPGDEGSLGQLQSLIDHRLVWLDEVGQRPSLSCDNCACALGWQGLVGGR